jgi:hypothetical protein
MPARKPSARRTRQIASRKRECAISTWLYRARIAFRMRVNSSAIGSVWDIGCYQLAFTTPGKAPRSANFRKHNRHILKRR